MGLRKKRDSMSLGPMRVDGDSSPATMSGLVGYWDARDVPSGAITAWAPRASNGLIGTLTGTGTGVGSGSSMAVSQPRLVSTNQVGASGIAATNPFCMWLIGTVTDLGNDSNTRTLLHVSEAVATDHASGINWYNYSGNVSKITSAGNIIHTPVGIAQKSINVKYLWIVNFMTSTTGRMHTYTEDSTVTALTTANFAASAVFNVGRNWNAQANVLLQGSVSACGLFNKNLSTDEIASMRLWANQTFAVAS